jgi:hypothetical protein
MDQTTAGLRLVGDYSGANPLVDIGYYTSGVVSHVNWVNRVRVLNNGNVGIGTTTPGALLDVNGNSKILNTLYLSDGDPVGGFGLNIGDVRVGSVNTTNSDFIIFNLGTVEGTGAIRFSDSANYNYNEWAGLEYHVNGRLMLGGPRMFVNNSSPASVRELVLAASSSVDFVITGSNGFVGVGMNAPLSRLHVAGDIRASLCKRISSQSCSIQLPQQVYLPTYLPHLLLQQTFTMQTVL